LSGRSDGLNRRLFETMVNLQERWEVICVDDGSSDRVLEFLREEQTARQGMTIVALARNFGQYAAIMAGFAQSHGQWVITLDADLQLDLLTGFSLWPMRALFFVGTGVACLGFLLGLLILALRFYYGPGWTAEGRWAEVTREMFLSHGRGGGLSQSLYGPGRGDRSLVS